MTTEPSSEVQRWAPLLKRVMPSGQATRGDALFFYAAAATSWLFAMGLGSAVLGAWGPPRPVYEALALVVAFGSIVAGFACAGVALRWLRMRSVRPALGCLALPALLFLALVPPVLGMWPVVMFVLLGIDLLRSRASINQPPLRRGDEVPRE